MSGGLICKCDESKKPIEDRAWEVWQRHCNHSAFNGWHHTISDWSAVHCTKCLAGWRTKAEYVHHLKDASL